MEDNGAGFNLVLVLGFTFERVHKNRTESFEHVGAARRCPCERTFSFHLKSRTHGSMPAVPAAAGVQLIAHLALAASRAAESRGTSSTAVAAPPQARGAGGAALPDAPDTRTGACGAGRGSGAPRPGSPAVLRNSTRWRAHALPEASQFTGRRILRPGADVSMSAVLAVDASECKELDVKSALAFERRWYSAAGKTAAYEVLLPRHRSTR